MTKSVVFSNNEVRQTSFPVFNYEGILLIWLISEHISFFYFMAVLWAITSGTEYLILIDRKKHKRLMEKYGHKICVGMATKEQ